MRLRSLRPGFVSLLALFVLIFSGLVLAGCGGGGGGPQTVAISGVVEVISNGGAPNPAATVRNGSVTTTTAADGAFSINLPPGSSFVEVVFTPSGGTARTFRYDFTPATSSRDLGRLIVGPEQVNVSGTVTNASTSAPISGATVTLGGVRGITSADGRFLITGVPYDPAVPGTFLGLEGRIGATGFFPRLFFPASAPSGDPFDLGDFTLQPDSGTAPPGTPYNIQGLVSPANQANGSVVELFEGTTLIRRFDVGADRQYGFWVRPGSYVIRARRPGTPLVSGDINVTLSSPSDTVVRDVTLN